MATNKTNELLLLGALWASGMSSHPRVERSKRGSTSKDWRKNKKAKRKASDASKRRNR